MPFFVISRSQGQTKGSAKIAFAAECCDFDFQAGRVHEFVTVGDSSNLRYTAKVPNRSNPAPFAVSALRTWRTMQLLKGKLIILMLSVIGIDHAAFGQSAIDQLQPLIASSARRLAIAKQVALAKWDNHTAVEDASRESRVISAASDEGASKGLDRTFVSRFFAAQIEANKLVQYSLLAKWARTGKVPVHKSINLSITIRPELDRLDKELVRELVETRSLRARESCRTDTAKAVGKYLSDHRGRLGSLEAIALDRAMANTCV